MNRINGFGLLLAGLMALNVALPVYAGGTAETTATTTTTTPATTSEVTTATQPTATTTTTTTTTSSSVETSQDKPAADQAKTPMFGWLQSLTNGFNAIKNFFVPKVMSDTEKMVNGAQQAAVKFENAATKAGDAVTEAAGEVKAGMAEIRGVVAGAKQMFANGLAATKLDGLMKDESVQTLKEHAPLIFGVTVVGVALFAAAWMFKANLETLAKPLFDWINQLGSTATPVVQ